MQEYYLDRGPKAPGLTIEGDNIINAIESYFETLAGAAKIGNSAGYRLESVVVSYDPDILGGTGGALVTIKARGDEGLVNYDEANDPVKTYRLEIGGVTRDIEAEDIPRPVSLEIKQKEQFSPFADTSDYTRDGYRYGVIWGLIDEVARNHTTCGTELSLTDKVSLKYDTLDMVSPKKFTDVLMRSMQTLVPDGADDTLEILDRIHALRAEIKPREPMTPATLLAQAKTLTYFRRLRQASSLLDLRNRLGKTQLEIAYKAGISLRQYQRLESGESSVGTMATSAAVRLAHALNTTVSEIAK